ncbi:MAG: N-acetylmuramoyl-L-alanine amidase [Clostridium sp.]
MKKLIKRTSISILVIFVINMFASDFFVKSVSAEEQLTLIEGNSKVSQKVLVDELLKVNPNKSEKYAKDFVSMVFEEANAEGLRADVAFAQMMKETNYLKFTGVVTEDQNNFGGLGATGEIDPETGKETKGLSFKDIRTGIRANIQHLKAYANTKALNKTCVDPRFKYVKRGSSKYVEWLGIQENPNGSGWAADKNYGYDIINMVRNFEKVAYVDPISIQKLPDNIYTNMEYTANINSNNGENVKYQYWLLNKSNDTWTKLKDWTTSKEVKFTANSAVKYRLEVHAKNIYSDKSYDRVTYTDFEGRKANFASNASFDFNKETIHMNENHNVTAKGTSQNKILYQYWLLDKQKDKWVLLKDYDENNKLALNLKDKGNYRLELHIKDQNSKNNYDDLYYKDFKVTNKTVSSLSIENLPSEIYNDTKYTLNVKSSGSDNPLYRYWLLDKKKGEWILLKDWTDKTSADLNVSGTGDYRVEIQAKDKYSDNNYDKLTNKDIKVKSKYADNLKIKVSPEIILTGNDVKIDSNATSQNEVLYQYWALDKAKDEWVIIKDWSNSKSLNWKPDKKGNYRVEVHAKDSKSNKNFDSLDFKDITVYNRDYAKNTKLELDNNNIFTGNTVGIKGSAQAENKVLYQYWILDKQKDEWILLQDWNENKNINWKPTAKGNYRVELHTKDITTNKVYDDLAFKDIYVKQSDLAKNAKIYTDTNEFNVNKQVEISASADSQNDKLYSFWLLDKSKGSWTLLQDWTKFNYVKWTPIKDGDYRLEVHVKDESSTKTYDDLAFKDISIKRKQKIVIDPGHNINTVYGVDTGARKTFNGKTYKEEDLNMQMSMNLKRELESRGYQVFMTQDPLYVSYDRSVVDSLKRRNDFAKSKNPDYFISVHHNSADDERAKGVEVYYSTKREVSTPSSIINSSRDSANRISSNIASKTGMSNRGGKDAGMYVTRMNNLRSVLVECGFITNKSEAEKVSSSSHQQKVADIISDVIEDSIN